MWYPGVSPSNGINCSIIEPLLAMVQHAAPASASLEELSLKEMFTG